MSVSVTSVSEFVCLGCMCVPLDELTNKVAAQNMTMLDFVLRTVREAKAHSLERLGLFASTVCIVCYVDCVHLALVLSKPRWTPH